MGATIVSFQESREEETIRRYLEAKEQKAFWTKEFDKLKKDILSRIAENDTKDIGKYKVKHSVKYSFRIDTTALKRDFPEVEQEYPKQVASHEVQVV